MQETKKAQVKPNQDPQPGSMGNNVGVIVPQTKPDLSGSGQLPADKAETKEEGYWDRFKRGAKDGAQYYKDNLSQPMHEFAGSAMDKGGTIATVGAGTTLAGGALTATGVAAPVGVPMSAAGAATTAVGTGVAGVGAATEGAATVFDSAADAIIKGEAPNVVKPALGLAAKYLEKAVRKIPGAGKLLDKAQEVHGKVIQAGGYIEGTGGPCIVGKYKDIVGKCGTGGQAHHIVADRSNRTGNRAGGAKGIGRIPGLPDFNGPAICLQGNARTAGSEHNTAHEADKTVEALGKRTDNGPLNTAPIGEIKDIYKAAAIKARPECAQQINDVVEKAYRDVDPKQSGRTTDQLPKGEAKDHLDKGGMSNRSRGKGR